MDKKKFDSYIKKIKNYTENVTDTSISANSSLNSLIKSGICNQDKKIDKKYADVE